VIFQKIQIFLLNHQYYPYEYQEFGFRLHDLYGRANPVEDMTQIIDLSDLNNDVLDDVSESVYTYAELFDRYGGDQKNNRKPLH
jgi:hypothetical protein